VFVSAGQKVIVTFFPVCSPIPDRETGFASVF